MTSYFFSAGDVNDFVVHGTQKLDIEHRFLTGGP